MSWFRSLALRWHRLRLRLATRARGEHAEYLAHQMQEAMARRAVAPPSRVRRLVELFIRVARPAATSRILCVGCRTGLELDVFREKGFPLVTGIDLFSERPDVRIMDMHSLDFPSGSFDVIFSSHSLEHSIEPARAVAEMLRVAAPGAVLVLEVPIHVQTSRRERQDYGSSAGLIRLFGERVVETLLAEEHPARSAANDEGSEIARAILRLN